MARDPFDLKNLELPPEMLANAQPAAAKKTRKQREPFAQITLRWMEKLAGANGQTMQVALYVLHRHWKRSGEPVKLPNEPLTAFGVDRFSKRRALRDLERRGLILVEWRPRKSPIVTPQNP